MLECKWLEKLIVGDSTESEPSTPYSGDDEETPGFGIVLGVMAVIGIALISRRL